MGNKTGKTYYEILDVPVNATIEEIEQAYRRARATYGEDSVAIYSLYSDEEKQHLLGVMKKAYETLRDSAKRGAYDAALAANEGLSAFMGSGLPGGNDDRRSAVDSDAGEDVPGLIFKIHPHSTDEVDPLSAEQYRVLYTKLESISIKKSYKVFAVTSAVKGEGKTVTTTNLANVIARDFRKRVAVLECDFKKPSILDQFLKHSVEHDIMDLIEGKASLREVIRRVEDTSFYLIPARRAVRNSSELLGSTAIRRLVEHLKTEFDYVLVDSPPIIHLADINIISKFVDGLILVVRAKKTPKDLVVKATKSVMGADIVGIVLNGADISHNRYYYR